MSDLKEDLHKLLKRWVKNKKTFDNLALSQAGIPRQAMNALSNEAKKNITQLRSILKKHDDSLASKDH